MSAKFSMLLILCVCAVGYSAKQDSTWTVSLTVSDVPGSQYQGEVEMLVIFKDKSQHSTNLPTQEYFPGFTFDFPVRLTSAGPIEAVYLKTRGFCPLGLMPVNVLRLRKVQLVSRSTNTAYIKVMDDLAVKDSCQANTQGTQLTDFREDTVVPCVMEGLRYEHGQRFDMGCQGRCRCLNGSVECVDMCAPMEWEPSQKCKFVHVPGQCCDQIICLEDEKIKTCKEASLGKAVSPGNQPLRRYPWSVMFCTNVKCSEIYGGVIVGEKHILTYAPALNYLSQLYVVSGEYLVDQSNISDFTALRILNATSHPDFVNQDSPIADSASRLQIFELEHRFQYDRNVQAANLPFNNEHCQQLSKNGCPTMVVGWDRTDDSDNQIRQWWLHADMVKRDESLCRANSSKTGISPKIMPRRRGEKRACVGGLVRDDCTGPLAGTLVTNAANVDFVVGLTDPDSALFYCNHPGTADVLPLCKYVDWINSLIS